MNLAVQYNILWLWIICHTRLENSRNHHLIIESYTCNALKNEHVLAIMARTLFCMFSKLFMTKFFRMNTWLKILNWIRNKDTSLTKFMVYKILSSKNVRSLPLPQFLDFLNIRDKVCRETLHLYIPIIRNSRLTRLYSVSKIWGRFTKSDVFNYNSLVASLISFKFSNFWI